MDELELATQTGVDRLPALIDHARYKLAEARTSAEVLEAKHVAEAALHYAKVTDAANEAHADCLRIITRAEIRLSREIDAGQERGEIAGPGQRSNVRTPDVSDLGDLGLDRRRTSEWRDLAEAGEEAVDAAIDEAAEEARQKGRTVTKNAVRRKVAGGTANNPIAERPERLNRLSIWLRNGAEIVDLFQDQHEVLALAHLHGVLIDRNAVADLASFLAALDAAMEGDRAA